MNQSTTEVTTPEVHETNTDNPIDFPTFIDQATRNKNARALKKEQKKAVKAVSQKFGKTLAKKMVKSAVKRIERTKAAGRGR